MPVYQYFCAANGRTLEVFHRMDEDLVTWGEVCACARESPGDTSEEAPVERILYAVGVRSTVGDSQLKDLGFTKLVRRDRGVYENVTASGKESRYVRENDPSTLPHLGKKIRD